MESKKQTSDYNRKERDSQIHREQTSGYQWEEGMGRDKRGVGDSEIQTTTYKINKPQGYIVQHKECRQQFIITINRV